MNSYGFYHHNLGWCHVMQLPSVFWQTSLKQVKINELFQNWAFICAVYTKWVLKWIKWAVCQSTDDIQNIEINSWWCKKMLREKFIQAVHHYVLVSLLWNCCHASSQLPIYSPWLILATVTLGLLVLTPVYVQEELFCHGNRMLIENNNFCMF